MRSRLPVILGIVALGALGLLASAPAWSHGASRGLHLHLEPDPARRGAKVRVELNAAEPVREVRISFVGQEPRTVGKKRARTKLRLKLKVPEGVEGETASIQAEAITEDGDVLRAAAILRLE